MLESPPVLLSDDPCNYLAVWETAYACPSHALVGTQCRVQDEITGLTFDVTSLATQPLTLELVNVSFCHFTNVLTVPQSEQ